MRVNPGVKLRYYAIEREKENGRGFKTIKKIYFQN
jgi:hypothetical protein